MYLICAHSHACMHACNHQSSLTYNEKIVHEHHGLLSVWEKRAGIPSYRLQRGRPDMSCIIMRRMPWKCAKQHVGG